jgi:hypothetical protein
MSDRQEAQTAVANLLLEKIRADRHPSTTHMQLLEQIIPRPLVRDYLNVLLEKVLTENHPSIPMLQRIVRIAQSM